MIIIDIETTGQDPAKNALLGIGAVDFCNPENQFYQECKIWDGAEIEQTSLDVNMNPYFDREFIKEAAKRNRMILPFSYRLVDLHTICYSHLLQRGLTPKFDDSGSKMNTDKILAFVGLPAEPKPHNALTGAKIEAEAISRFLYGKPLLEEFNLLKIK